jgi:hypothetical protein
MIDAEKEEEEEEEAHTKIKIQTDFEGFCDSASSSQQQKLERF